MLEGVHVRAQPRLPSADRAWPRPRCRNWRPARPRTAAPARLRRCAGHRREWSRRPNRQTSSRRLCAPAAAPRRVSSASAGTARRSASSDSRPGSPRRYSSHSSCRVTYLLLRSCSWIAAKSGGVRAGFCSAMAWFPAREHRRFHPCFVPILRQRPGDARRLGAFQVLVNRAHPDRATSPDLLVAQFEFESEA